MTIESRSLNGHGPLASCAILDCPDCAIAGRLIRAWPEIINWAVVGEGVVRGQHFQHDVWRYVLLRDMRCIDVTAEALADNEEGFHAAALQALATGRAEQHGAEVRWPS